MAAPRREGVAGYVFLSPWLLGLMGITAIPMIGSLILSFTNYDLLSPWSELEFVGVRNYTRMFTDDPHYWHAVTVTVMFALVAVPLKLAAALGVAMLLNKERRGTGLFRGCSICPSLLGGSVALALVWRAMWNDERRRQRLPARCRHRRHELDQRARLRAADPCRARGLAVRRADGHLPGRPQADPEGALRCRGRRRCRAVAILPHITLPGLSPVIFFNLVLETINGFQGFTVGLRRLAAARGGPVDSTLMYTLYLYQSGFTDYEMGYASAMAWVFLIAIAVITAVLFSTGKFWVHYGDEK